MKRALVTGGSGGIGAAICRKLAAEGCHVYVHANHSLPKAAEIAAQIRAGGGSAQAVAFDVANAEQTLHKTNRLLSRNPATRLPRI